MEMKQISDSTIKSRFSWKIWKSAVWKWPISWFPRKTEEFFYTILDELEMPDNFFGQRYAELPCDA